MPGRNSVPLEKVLLQVDLSKGLDESARPEVGGDQSKLITTLENLVQEQDGAWVLRQGLSPVLLSTNDDSGTNVGILERLHATHDGLCAMGTTNKFYQWQESAGILNYKGKASEWGLESLFLGASQTAAHASTQTYSCILATASDRNYAAVIFEGGANGTNYGAVLCIYDKYSGSQVGRYTVPIPSGTGAGSRPKYLMTFVNGDSLHIYTYNQAGGDLMFTSLTKVSSLWPLSGTALPALSATPLLAITGLYDICARGTRSFVVTGNTGACSSDGASKAGKWHSCDVDDFGRVWFVGIDAGTNRLAVQAVLDTNIGGANVVAWVDPTITPNASSTLSAAVTSTSGSLSIVENNPGVTFGGTTIPQLTVYSTVSTGSTSASQLGIMYGWKPASKPFFMNRSSLSSGLMTGSGLAYIHLYKHTLLTGTSTATHCLVSLEATDIKTNDYRLAGGPSSSTAYTFRPAAVLEAFNGSIPSAEPRYVPYLDSDSFPAIDTFISYQGVQRGSALGCYKLKNQHPKTNNSAQFCGETFLGGGALESYDGARLAESGIIDEPVMTSQTAAGALTGSYNYVAVFRYLDARGNAHFSKTYGPISLTLAAQTPTFTIQPCNVTAKESGITSDTQMVCELYRTASGGTQYYLLTTSQIGGSFAMTRNGAFLTFADSTTDATLIAKPQLYRQPGTSGTALDRVVAPGNYGVVCAHKDRLYVADPYGFRLYYSSFFVDGEQPWFNAQLNFQVHGGTGPITGLASMDGRLLVFRKDAIFVVDGDGPPENGGTGAEFSPPTRIATEFGCVDHRSILLTPLGVMYRSKRGIELLTRSLQVMWIGERVMNTVAAYPVTRAALIYKGRCIYFLSSSESVLATGKAVVYDLTQDCWCTFKYTFDGTYGAAVRGAAVVESGAGSSALTNLMLIGGADFSYPFLQESETDGDSTQDRTTDIPWTIETGWVRPGGSLARFRFHDAFFLGKTVSSSTLPSITLSAAYDYAPYGAAIYSNKRVFSSTSYGAPDPLRSKQLLELNLQPKMTTPVTFRFKVEGTGAGVDVLGATFVVSPKAGAVQVAEAKKG